MRMNLFRAMTSALCPGFLLLLSGAFIGGCRGPAPMPPPGAAASAPPDSAGSARILAGCRYDTARAIVETYCADCHSAHGKSRAQARAHRDFSVDTYAEWIAASRAVPGRVDKDSLEDKIMPPPRFPAQPTDTQRKLLVDWVKRGSPNTPQGK